MRKLREIAGGITASELKALENLTIDDCLLLLIDNSDIVQVVACLDSIAQEDGQRVELRVCDGERVYPHPDI